jgi:type I restriction enzyme, S subunit
MAGAGQAKYRPYPAYKPSGVEWLGDIPEGWEAIRLKLTSDFRNEKRNPNPSDNYVGLENVVPWIGSYNPSQDQQTEGLSLSFSEGDLLFGKLRPYLAKSWLADFGGVCSSEFLVISSKILDPKFINYVTLTEDFINQVDGSTYGSKMPRANSEFIGQLKIPIPHRDDATKIAAFLDYETGKIDGLIAKQQRLIALLEEKRQAVISHAVTKGLDPTAPLRPSGIDWLGDVPAHWEVSKLGWLCEVARGSGYQNIVMNIEGRQSVKMLRIGDMHEVIPVDIVKNREVVRYTVREGDILVAGTGATAGISMLIDADTHGLIHSYNSIRIRIRDAKILSKFLSYFLRSDFVASLFEVSFSGSAQHFIDTKGLRVTALAIPPTGEQIEIVSYLDEANEKFSSLLGKAQSAITLLKERRTALISAAVTGKIDLRGWQAPTEPANITQDKEVLA